MASFFLSRIHSNIDAHIDAKLKAGVDEINQEAKLRVVQGQVAIAKI